MGDYGCVHICKMREERERDGERERKKNRRGDIKLICKHVSDMFVTRYRVLYISGAGELGRTLVISFVTFHAYVQNYNSIITTSTTASTTAEFHSSHQ